MWRIVSWKGYPLNHCLGFLVIYYQEIWGKPGWEHDCIYSDYRNPWISVTVIEFNTANKNIIVKQFFARPTFK